MTSTKFIAILPQPTQAGDKIKISGKITDNAEEFSINFANEVNEDPQSIAYHFKWDLANKTIVEDYKEDSNWMDRIDTKLDAFNGRLKNSLMHSNKAFNDNINSDFLGAKSLANTADASINCNSYFLLGPEFTLEFSFLQDDICVYLIGEDGPNYVSQYQPKSDFQCIESVQVWGDVEKISQLTFSYN
ncbi:uncharacterized protein LOC101462912 isoform X1 [Ceratitis capitata]|uniref:uncharacterized protein LOC101462912 isoform X1 n=1 Tax=Ceratitis capitata TaxID=7213 RepID=UPI000A10C5CE|nr:uncharacterized protein LOC101462912 isoform X1 [Ceratitis capitata]